LVKLIEMRRVAPIEKILERLTKLEAALANGNSASETVVRAAPPLEKKTLKVDFPLAEVPFPTKEVSSPKSQVPSQNLSEPPASAGGLSAALSETTVAASALSVVPAAKPQTAPELPVSDFKFQTDEIPEFVIEKENSRPVDSNFETVIQPQRSDFVDEKQFENLTSTTASQFETSNLKSEFRPQTTDNRQQKTDEAENPPFAVGNSKLADVIRSMPVKMLPITSEELEHFDDDKLDTAYDNKLLRAGDNLFPIANAAKIAAELTGTSQNPNGLSALSENPNGSGAAATATAKAKPIFEIPNFDVEEESEELPVLPENPTPDELLAYAQKHPSVKKVLRAFRGKIVEVKKL
jgi:hypothetical protein